jgi:bacteriorhodopsin
MENMENLLNYTPTQWTIVLSVLTLGYAAMASGLVYFFMTRDRAAPKYRLSSTLSAVVMISAFLELFRLAQNWINSFAFTGQFWEQSGSIFSNGFRYMNWSIDVPVLLTQILIVMGVTGRRFKSAWAKFVIAGLGMIWTGYIGQFYETAFVYDGISLAPYWIWGIISTIFFIYILFLVWKEIPRNFHYLPEPAVGMMKAVRWLLTISWFLYPIAYLIPVVWFDAWGVVARQIIFTVADVTSKVIYGVMLSRVATLRSQAEGYQIDEVIVANFQNGREDYELTGSRRRPENLPPDQRDPNRAPGHGRQHDWS